MTKKSGIETHHESVRQEIEYKEERKKVEAEVVSTSLTENTTLCDESVLNKIIKEMDNRERITPSYPNLPVSDPYSERISAASKAFSQNLEKKIFEGLGVPETYLPPASAVAKPFSEQDFKDAVEKLQGYDSIGASQSVDQLATNSLQRVISMNSNDDILNALFMKMGRSVSEKVLRATKDYIIRNSISVTKTFDVTKNRPTDEHDFLDKMARKLKTVPGVSGIQSLTDDYPEVVSIILKIDMSYFEDDEVERYMEQIDNIIQFHKPEDLKEFEVLFHNKVVY